MRRAAEVLPRRKTSVGRLLSAARACLGVFITTGELVVSGGSIAQPMNYRALDAAPPAWQECARQLQARLQTLLVSNEEAIRQVHALLEQRAAANVDPTTIVAKVWVAASGKIDWVKFEGVDDDGAVALRNVIGRQADGSAPPPDMFQPIHLRLSLSNAG